MHTRTFLLALTAAGLALPISQPVFAQDDLEEVVVTARKREENIFEIPVAVSAISGDDLQRAGIGNGEDLSSFVAGLQFEGSTSTAGRWNPSIRLRGMNQQIITPATQTGALFWDGSFVGGGGGVLPFADVERVEVIKGPQTAYFGRNTFSGAVNIIPKRPGDEWETNVGLEYSPSQEAEYKAEIGFGGPITDNIGLRVHLGHEKDGGDFNTQDGEPYAVFEDTSISGTMTFEPTDNLSLKLTGYYVTAEDNGTSIGVDAGEFGVPAGECDYVYTGEYLDVVTGERTPFTRDIGALPFATFCGQYPDGENLVAPVTVRPTADQAEFVFGPEITALNNYAHPFMEDYDILPSPPGMLGGRYDTWRGQLSGDYDFADHTLSFLWSHVNSGFVNRRDFRFGIANTPIGCSTFPDCVLVTGADTAIRENYYEARIASSDDRRLRYMIGVSDYRQGYRNATTRAAFDWQDNSTTAIFGGIDYDFTDALTLSVEARYTDEESVVVIGGNPNLGCDSPAVVCELPDSFTDFIPRVILSFQPFEGATLYGSYSYSSMIGLRTRAEFIASVAPGVIPPEQVEIIGSFTPPQENTQYEIGWKQQGDKFSFAAAAYFSEWDNQPFAAVVLLPTGGTSALVSAGNSEYTGFEVEFSWTPTDWMDLVGTVGYVDSELITFSSRGSNEFIVLGSGPLSVVNDGRDVRNTPPLTWSLSPTFYGEAAGRPWYLRFDVLYRDEAWADYSEFNRIGDQTLVNARAGLALSDRYTIELYGKNLTDDKTLGLNGGTTTGPGGDRKAYNEPYQKPEVGIRFTADF